MGKKKGFTAAFKLTVVKQLEKKKLMEVCRAYNLAPSTLFDWKKQYDESPKDAFRESGDLWRDDPQVVNYERIIAQLYAENIFLKKTSEIFQERIGKEKNSKR